MPMLVVSVALIPYLIIIAFGLCSQAKVDDQVGVNPPIVFVGFLAAVSGHVGELLLIFSKPFDCVGNFVWFPNRHDKPRFFMLNQILSPSVRR